jgi:hypothetical protein
MRAFLFLILTCLSIKCVAQNIYDESSSLRYSKHLISSKKFELAIIELERIHFLSPHNDTVSRDLAYCFNKSDQWNRTIELFKDRAPEPLFSNHLLLALINTKEYDNSLTIAKNPTAKQPLFIPATYALKHDVRNVKRSIDSLLAIEPDQRMMSVYSATLRYQAQRKKNPWVASTLALFPGAGKLYTKDHGDAFAAFLTVTTMAFESYRGFSRKGIDSKLGWACAGIGLGFYTGSIYGSWKAAMKYNQRRDDSYDKSIRDILFTDY